MTRFTDSLNGTEITFPDDWKVSQVFAWLKEHGYKPMVTEKAPACQPEYRGWIGNKHSAYAKMDH